VFLKEELNNSITKFEFQILAFDKNTTDTSDSNARSGLIVKGETHNCEKSWCTVLIAFLASLCLILFTGLTLSLIILRRKKPFRLSFQNSSDNEANRNISFNETDNER